MNSASVLTLHDSIELFFVLACKHLEIEGESSFIGYFDKIKTKSSNLIELFLISKLDIIFTKIITLMFPPPS
jgi:hypothetical protein